MNLSLHAKLFLAFLLATLLAVIATAGFVRWSLAQGLLDLVQARERERLETVAARLLEFHALTGSWDALRADPRLWQTLLTWRGERLLRDWEQGRGGRGYGAGRGWGHGGPGPGPGLEGPRRGPPGAGASGPEGQPWPPHAGPPLPHRLVLLDPAGTVVTGAADSAAIPWLAHARRLPLERDGQRLGELALRPGPAAAELADVRFIETQGGRLWWMALAVLLLSAALAYPLAHWLARPVRRCQTVARQLTAGDFSARVPLPAGDTRVPAGGDEIARLAQDLNILALTLERNEQTRRRWVADLAHELRTPVALLRAELEALQDGVRTPDAHALARLHEDTLRLSRLIEDLHQLALTDLGALAYRMQSCDLAAVLHADLASFQSAFRLAGLALHRADPRGEDAAAPFQGDPQRLSQLFGNLLRNSLAYTDPGGGLWVRLRGDGSGGYVIDFEDTAPGVPPADLPRLCERLYRVEASRSRRTGGAGLGLAIAANIVEAHGGTLTARASRLGGLWIEIRLPGAPA